MDDLVKIINNNYSMDFSTIEKNDDSTDGNVYMVNTHPDKYVIKVYDDVNHTIAMTNLHDRLSSLNFNVPMIIRNKSNDLYTSFNDHKYIVMYSFLNGVDVGSVLKSDCTNTSIKIAQEIRALHDSTLSDNDIYNLGNVPYNVDKYLNRKSVLHFDLTKSNIFYNKDFKSNIGFIDFDDAKYGPSVVDVSIVISLLYISKKDGINIDGIKNFIDAYYGDDFKLKEEEIKYIKEFAILWLDYTLSRNVLDVSTIESFEIKKKLIESELDFQKFLD